MQYILNESEYNDLQSRIRNLESTNHNLAASLLEAGRDMDGMSQQMRDLQGQIAYFQNLAGDRYDRLQKVMEERNALQASLEKAQKRIEHSEHLSERRLRLANELQTKVQRLKHEPVAIVLNPSTKRYRAVSLDKVDTYERYGWVVLDEGYVVDRPA